MSLNVQSALTHFVREAYIACMIHLSDYMAAKELTDEVVAVAIGRSRVTVSRLRRRKARPDWATMEKIKEFTGGAVMPNDFLAIAPPLAPEGGQ